MGFTSHIIHIANGEDIGTRIMAFSPQGPRSVCILSGTGAVSTVTLRQPATPGGSITYEGRFEILSLSGSLLLTESGGSCNRAGGINITLASPNGRVIGGVVAGVLIAACPVQVILGSFPWGGSKTKKRKRDGSEGAEVDVESDHQGVHNLVAMNSNQKLTPNMRNSHVDIDLLRR